MTTWDAAITDWRTSMRAAGRPETTIRTRTQHVRQLAADRPGSPWRLDGHALIGWVAEHPDWKPASRRAVRSSLRTFYAWAVHTGALETNPALALPPVRPTPPAPHPLPADILAGALERARPRERAMVTLAVRCGLRRGEVARVHTRDVVTEYGGRSLIVHGKGGRNRVVPLPDDVARMIDRAAPAGGGFLFPGADHGHLSPQWVGHLISGLLPDGWAMHSLRHAFASSAYRATTDLLAVQQLLGHASPDTTQLYVKLPDDALRRAVNLAAA